MTSVNIQCARKQPIGLPISLGVLSRDFFSVRKCRMPIIRARCRVLLEQRKAPIHVDLDQTMTKLQAAFLHRIYEQGNFAWSVHIIGVKDFGIWIRQTVA